MERRNRLAGALGVEPGEGLLAALLFCLSFCIAAPYVLGFTAGNALFLAAYGAEGLPYTYLASTAILVLAGAAFAWAERRLPLGRMLVGPWCALALLGAALYAGLRGAAPAWLTFALLTWAIVVGVFGELAFWALAGRLLNLAQGKRLFGLVGAGALVARLALYSGTALVVTAIGTVSLLLIALAAMALALLLVAVILRRSPPLLPAPPAPAAAARAPGLGSPRSRYIALILGLVLIGELGYTLLEFFFFGQIAAAFPEPDRLAQVLGLFAGGTFLLATLISAALTGAALRRFGIRFGLLSEPAAMALAMLAALGAALLAPLGGALFVVVIAAKVLDDVLDSALNKPAGQLLFQPLPAAERVAAQTLATSVVEPVAVGLTGALLLLFQAAGITGGPPLAGSLLALAAAWLALAAVTYRAYVAAIGRALARRLVGSATLTLDAAGLAVVEQALASPRAVEVLGALDLLQSERPARYAARLPALLAHAEPGVRREALARVGALGLAEALPAVRALAAEDGDPAVRAAAVQALALLGDTAAAALADPDPAVRAAALTGQLRHGDRAGAEAALAALAASPDPAERAVAARVAGGHAAPLYAALLRDADPAVRAAALRAAGPALPPELWPLFVGALGEAVSRGAALAGLEAGGPAALPALAAALADPATPDATRAQLARACGRIRGPAAVAALLGALDAPADELREAAVAALRRCAYAAGHADEPRIRARIGAELALADACAAARADLAAEPHAALLRQALVAQQAALLRRALTLLGFLVDPQLARQVADGLAAPSAERRAYAAELLETRVRPELRAPFAPFVAGRAEGRAGDAVARLRALIGAPAAAAPPWVRACALYAAGQRGARDLADAARGCLGHQAPLVRELAAWAVARLAPAPVAAPAAAVARAAETSDGPARANQGGCMLNTVERVIILKGVGIFAATPDPVLAELAALLAEEEAPAGRPIFAKGEPGASLYIIVEGEVRVHDGAATLNHLGEREVFGEMALLDPAPRSASVTAVAETLLLRLDAEPFNELMEDRIEIARGVIAVLSGRLRDRMRDLDEARRAHA